MSVHFRKTQKAARCLFLYFACWCVVGALPQTPPAEPEEGRLIMANRERNVRLEIKVTEEEAAKIKENMTMTGTTNFSLYARKMLLDGYVIKVDFSELRGVTSGLGQIARNLYQIAKRANETRSVYASDLEEVRRAYYQDFAKLKEQVTKAIKTVGK